jgi:filamentous hemagglutinin family protein
VADPTLNSKVTTAGNQNGGTTYTITNGFAPSTSGKNLFHSFGSFSLNQHDVAKFNNTYQPGCEGACGAITLQNISNIFARVTGKEMSTIDGLIDTKTGFPNANFWFLNPNGIIFNSNANLNIGGAATFTTANSLIFDNGGKFGFQGGEPTFQGNLSIASVASLDS